MSNTVQIGDYVEVDIGNGWCISAYAKVISERANPRTHVRMLKVKFKTDGKNSAYAFGGNRETHEAEEQFVRTLSEKEIFELRLKGLIE